MIAGATLRLAAYPAIKRSNDDSGNRADKEGRTPTPQGAEFSAGQVSESRANGDGQIEDGENAVALSLRVKICQHCWSKDNERRLAHSHDGVADVERPIVVDPCRSECSDAPQQGAANDEGLASEVVAQPACEWRDQHVDHKQRRGKSTHLLVSGVKLALDERDFTGQNVAVNVVEEVEADEQD